MIIENEITEIWSYYHPHLRPISKSRESRIDRPSYADGSVLADLEFDGHWLPEVEVSYQLDPLRYWISNAEWSRIVRDRGKVDFGLIRGVNARLWTRQPTMITLEPTTRCNFKCWYCIGRHMVQADLNANLFPLLLDNFTNLKTIALVGEGEPLMHTEFFDMARLARDRGIRVLIVSNGSTFSRSNVQQLCEAEVAYVSISIDSISQQTFASSRIGGDLNKIWDGIARLRSYRDSNGYKYPKIALKGTLFSYSKNELPAIMDTAYNHGVEIFESFQALNPKDNYKKIYPQTMLTEVALADNVAECMARDLSNHQTPLISFETFCKNEGIEINAPIQNRLRRNCDETWLYSLLSGDITPCCQIKTSPSSEWNVFSRPMVDILTDPSYENMRFNLWNGIFLESCLGCWKTR